MVLLPDTGILHPTVCYWDVAVLSCCTFTSMLCLSSMIVAAELKQRGTASLPKMSWQWSGGMLLQGLVRQ